MSTTLAQLVSRLWKELEAEIEIGEIKIREGSVTTVSSLSLSDSSY